MLQILFHNAEIQLLSLNNYEGINDKLLQFMQVVYFRTNKFRPADLNTPSVLRDTFLCNKIKNEKKKSVSRAMKI